MLLFYIAYIFYLNHVNSRNRLGLFMLPDCVDFVQLVYRCLLFGKVDFVQLVYRCLLFEKVD